MFSLLTEQRAISWWRREGKDLTDLAPPYQRKSGQWSTSQRTYLIDSILNGFDLPKFYFADFTHARSPLNFGSRQYAIIDGRQRLETISEFANGELTLDKGFIFLDEPALDLAGMGLPDLAVYHPDIARRFDEFQLDIVLVRTDDEARVNDMFIRLNSGTGLTGAQVRNAMAGQWPAEIRAIADHEFFTARVGFSRRQGQDLNVAAKLLMLEFRGALYDTKRRQLDAFVSVTGAVRGYVDLAQAGGELVERAVHRVDDCLTRATEIFIPRDPLLRAQGPVTVYYWFLRDLDRTLDVLVRPFLVQFERERRANRVLVQQVGRASEVIDAELVAYDNHRRNGNDARSIEAMVQTLHGRFDVFASSNG